MRLETGAIALLACLVLAATPAEARGIFGLTGFPALMLFPLVYPLQILSILVATLVTSRTKPVAIWQAVVSFAIGLFLAQELRVYAPPETVDHYYWVLALVVICLGAFSVASFPYLALPVATPAIMALGAVVGFDTWGLGGTKFDQQLAAVGATVTSAIVLFVVGWLLSRPKPHWADILIRVVAAWVAACAVMVLAFAFKPETSQPQSALPSEAWLISTERLTLSLVRRSCPAPTKCSGLNVSSLMVWAPAANARARSGRHSALPPWPVHRWNSRISSVIMGLHGARSIAVTLASTS